MVSTSATLELQPLIEHQALVIETLRAHIAGFAALTSMIEAQEPLVPLGAAHEAVLAYALAGVA